MKRYGVRPSVRLSHSAAAAACGAFAQCCVPDRLLHGRRRNSTRPQHAMQQQMRAVPRFQPTYVR